MYNLGYAIRIIMRILRGEPFRKANADEKKEYALYLNLLALLVILYPWFVLLIEKYSHVVIWLSVMGFIIPSVILIFWNKESLPVLWNVILSFCIIAVPLSCLILSLLGITIKYSPLISAITFAVYLLIIVLRSCTVALKNREPKNEIDAQ